MGKRKNNSNDVPNKKEKRDKRDKVNIKIDNTCVSASATRNYLMKNTIVDWLELFGESNGYHPDVKLERAISASLLPSSSSSSSSPPSNVDNFGCFLMNQGIDFEKETMKELYKRFPNEIVDVKA